MKDKVPSTINSVCNPIYYKIYRQKNKELIKAQRRIWYQNNKEAKKLYQQAWRLKNKNKLKAYCQKYHKKNRLKIKLYKRQWLKTEAGRLHKKNKRAKRFYSDILAFAKNCNDSLCVTRLSHDEAVGAIS